MASRWVRGEAREAADLGTLVPARFDGARLPMDVRAIHTTDMDGWGDNANSPPIDGASRPISESSCSSSVTASFISTTRSRAVSAKKNGRARAGTVWIWTS